MRVAMATSPAGPDEPNEDFAGAIPQGVVLLDGAGLSGSASRCRHGVAWYTRHLAGALLAGLADESRDLTTILADAIGETAAAHAGTCDLSDPGTPSATVIALRMADDRLQYLVLADSVLVLDEVGGPPTVISDHRADDIGDAYRATLDSLPNGTSAHDEARRKYVEALRAHRNRSGGFWVAAADPAAATEAITGERRLRDIGRATMLSDGASRLSDRFGLAGWPETLALLDSYGPAEVIRRVREAEAGDPYGVRWPRAKTHDDATIVDCTGLREAAGVCQTPTG